MTWYRCGRDVTPMRCTMRVGGSRERVYGNRVCANGTSGSNRVQIRPINVVGMNTACAHHKLGALADSVRRVSAGSITQRCCISSGAAANTLHMRWRNCVNLISCGTGNGQMSGACDLTRQLAVARKMVHGEIEKCCTVVVHCGREVLLSRTTV